MRRSILVADDDKEVCEFIRRLLTAAGFDVDVAHDGNEAIQRFEQIRFDAALVDVIMPEKEGVETIIEARERWPACKLVAMSAGGRTKAEQFLDLAREFGVDATIKKPFRPQALIATMKGLFTEAP
jgi:DNA-binding response OmpR family regulator